MIGIGSLAGRQPMICIGSLAGRQPMIGIGSLAGDTNDRYRKPGWETTNDRYRKPGWGTPLHGVPGSVGAYAPPFSVPSYLKLTFAGLPASTVTSCVLVPYFSCQLSTVYFPGGTLSILKLPLSPLTACRPFLEMPMYPRIHGCTSHFHFIIPSSLAVVSIGAAFSFGMPLLKRVEAPMYVCTLCSTGS